MSTFTTPLQFEEVGEQEWKILSPFIYWVGEVNTGEQYFVPKGFLTDGASVPRLLWWLFPPVGAKYSKAAVVHDMLYSTEMLNRKECDLIFLEAMEVLGVPAWKRYSMYWAVRAAGWSAWEKHNDVAVMSLRTWVETEEIKYNMELENEK